MTELSDLSPRRIRNVLGHFATGIRTVTCSWSPAPTSRSRYTISGLSA